MSNSRTVQGIQIKKYELLDLIKQMWNLCNYQSIN